MKSTLKAFLTLMAIALLIVSCTPSGSDSETWDLVVPGIDSSEKGLTTFPQQSFLNKGDNVADKQCLGLGTVVMSYMPMIPSIRTIKNVNIKTTRLADLDLDFEMYGFKVRLDASLSKVNTDGAYLRYDIIERKNNTDVAVGATEYYYKWDGTLSYRQYVSLSMFNGYADPGTNNMPIYLDAFMVMSLPNLHYDAATKSFWTIDDSAFVDFINLRAPLQTRGEISRNYMRFKYIDNKLCIATDLAKDNKWWHLTFGEPKADSDEAAMLPEVVNTLKKHLGVATIPLFTAGESIPNVCDEGTLKLTDADRAKLNKEAVLDFVEAAYHTNPSKGKYTSYASFSQDDIKQIDFYSGKASNDCATYFCYYEPLTKKGSAIKIVNWQASDSKKRSLTFFLESEDYNGDYRTSYPRVAYQIHDENSFALRKLNVTSSTLALGEKNGKIELNSKFDTWVFGQLSFNKQMVQKSSINVGINESQCENYMAINQFDKHWTYDNGTLIDSTGVKQNIPDVPAKNTWCFNFPFIPYLKFLGLDDRKVTKYTYDLSQAFLNVEGTFNPPTLPLIDIH